MSNKRRALEDIFEAPLKIPCVQNSRRITPQRCENMSCESSSSSSPTYTFYENCQLFEARLNEYINNMNQEEHLVFEMMYEISPSMLCGTGFSMARDFYPVVKLAPIMNNISNHTSNMSFIQYDWKLFLVYLSGSITEYLNFGCRSTCDEIMFSDYVISFDTFLEENIVKVRHGESYLYLNKNSASRLLEISELLSIRLDMLDNLFLAQKYQDLLRKTNQILSYSSELSEEKTLELIKSLASISAPTINLCINEVLIYDKSKVLNDLYLDKQLYG